MSIFLNILLSLLFVSPVDFPIILSGNFGEPRPNHFHAGIDIKTDQVEGKAIRSIGDGFVSRVTVGKYGYGNAVFVQHPEGYTSVYCHLKGFAPQLKMLTTKKQYQLKSQSIDVRFSPTDYPVREGQLIALSGNTGASLAPHLHLEVFRTKTDELVDPLSLIGESVVDNTPPMAHGFMAEPCAGLGIFQFDDKAKVFPFVSHNNNKEYQAWGKVSFSVWANDYMEGSYGNKYGIRKTLLFVDDSLVFSSDVTNIPKKLIRHVNLCGNYSHYLRSHVWYMRSYMTNVNRLEMLQTDDNAGFVDFKEEKVYNLKYILIDAFNNQSEYNFKVIASPVTFSEPVKSYSLHPQTLFASRTNSLNLHKYQLIIPAGALEKDVEISPTLFYRQGLPNKQIKFANHSIPLLQDGKLIVKVGNSENTSKLYVTSNIFGVERRPHYVYRKGDIIIDVNDLGTVLSLREDKTPPIVRLTSNNKSGKSILSFAISDNESGLLSYETYIDGQFVLLEQVKGSANYSCNLKKTPIKPTNKYRSVTVKATDRVGNRYVYNSQMIY